MGSYELNKKLTVARERGYIFNQINKLTISHKYTLPSQIRHTSNASSIFAKNFTKS